MATIIAICYLTEIYSGFKAVTKSLEYNGSVGKVAMFLPKVVRFPEVGSTAPSLISI